MNDLLLLGTFVVAAFAGAIAHEVAHWIVWRVTGRRPRLDLWGLCVQPRAGPQRTTLGDRIAAAAPYAIGLTCVLGGLQSGVIAATVFGGAMIQIPSQVDVRTMLGRTEWAVPDATV